MRKSSESMSRAIEKYARNPFRRRDPIADMQKAMEGLNQSQPAPDPNACGTCTIVARNPEWHSEYPGGVFTPQPANKLFRFQPPERPENYYDPYGLVPWEKHRDDITPYDQRLCEQHAAEFVDRYPQDGSPMARSHQYSQTPYTVSDLT
jgi:hypothetical protein